MAKLLEVLVHSTGDCTAVRTRLPVPGVIPDSPASNGWQPGFMTDLMAKDLDLALAYAARAGVPMATTATARQALTAASTAGFGPRGLLGAGEGGAPPGRRDRRADPCLRPVMAESSCRDGGCAALRVELPAVILAADHRARGVITIEDVRDVRRRAARRARVTATASWRAPSRCVTWPTSGAIDGRATAPTCRSTAPDWPAARSSSTTGWWRPSSRPPPRGGPASST